LAQVILGASHLAQTAVPAALDASSNSGVVEWKAQIRQTLHDQATFLCHKLSQAPGLHVVSVPGGAMYAMARIEVDEMDDVIANDVDFSHRLVEEENVLVLPGSCFGMPNIVRLVFCAPVPVLEQAADRIHHFCTRHRKK
jgi:tyrosine aminotransferase